MNQTIAGRFAQSLLWCLSLVAVSCQEIHASGQSGTIAAKMNAALPQPGLIKSEFIFETAPFPECHASTIAETESGLVAAWFGGTHERHPDVGIWISRLADGKWTRP